MSELQGTSSGRIRVRTPASGVSASAAVVAQNTGRFRKASGTGRSAPILTTTAHVPPTARPSFTSRVYLAARRAGKVSVGAAAGALAVGVVALGGVDGAALFGRHIDPAMMTVAVAIAALVVATVIRRVQFISPSARAQRVSVWIAAATDLADIELALVLVAGVHVVIGVTGGISSPAYPLLYGLVAFAWTVMARPGAIATLGAGILLEGALVVREGLTGAIALEGGVHVAYLLGAAAAHALLLRGLTERYRTRRARRLEEELVALKESARDYRLIAAALGPASRATRGRDEEERLLGIGGVGMIEDSASWVLGTIKRSLAARTVALVWLDDDGERVKLKEIVSDADDIVENPRLPSAGVLGAVLRDRTPLLVAATKPNQLPYYQSKRAGVALVAVPIVEGGNLRGILAADRDAPFAEADRDLLADASAQLLRVVQAEQVFRAVERAKYEHERFYQATAKLGRALTVEQVIETAFDAAAEIAQYDVAILAFYDKERGKHRVAAVRVGPAGEGLVDVAALTDLEFKDNAGLASMVVKNRHYLPAGGEPREVTAPIYTRKVKLDDAKSLLVLPLLSADEPVGTLCLIARTEKRFGKDVREMLAVIATQVAISLENGFLYKKMETMATTDGLTGLTNHRTFQTKFQEMIDRAARHNGKVALLLCDVDHFKKVNDTYGHPIGDEVLRRVARVLQEVPRKIDVPARYGGEEFVVVLDNVDLAQAKAVAERIRTEIQKLVIETDKGSFSVTDSIGIAAFPDDGRDRATLIERADLALYHAKQTGRNRCITWTEAQAAKSKHAG
ncbi:MAG: sensor domain-containing diguanylate cyclase [Proteobacteria bacterium]|nr:sensor domain-containing diguanylate cyclase [Pseudomonadota bacterium]